MENFWDYGGLFSCLDVIKSVQDEIRASPSYSNEDEKRMAVLQYSLKTLPDMSWGKIAGVLWRLEEHTALEKVRQYLPHKPGDYNMYCQLYIEFPLLLDVHVYVYVHICQQCLMISYMPHCNQQ